MYKSERNWNGNWLQKKRCGHNMKQHELAEELDFSSDEISRYESNSRIPTIEKEYKIRSYFFKSEICICKKSDDMPTAKFIDVAWDLLIYEDYEGAIEIMTTFLEAGQRSYHKDIWARLHLLYGAVIFSYEKDLHKAALHFEEARNLKPENEHINKSIDNFICGINFRLFKQEPFDKEKAKNLANKLLPIMESLITKNCNNLLFKCNKLRLISYLIRDQEECEKFFLDIYKMCDKYNRINDLKEIILGSDDFKTILENSAIRKVLDIKNN